MNPAMERMLAALLILVVTFVCFGTSLRGEFVADDFLVVVGNKTIQSFSSIPQLFRQSYLFGHPDQGAYRPLSNVTFAFNFLLGKLNPLSYHLFNLLLHALNGFLIFILVPKYLGRNRLALFTSLLFIVHPVHTEAVSNIAGRPEMLASAGLLLGWLFFIKEGQPYYYWLSLVVYFLGLLAKENAIVLPGVLILAFLCTGKQKAPAYKYVGYLLVAGLYMLLRFWVLHGVGVPVAATLFKNSSLQTRIFTMSLGFVRYFKLLIWPRQLAALYDFSVIPLTSSLTPMVALSIVIIAGLLAIGVWCLWHQRLASFAILFFFVTISPVSNLIFPTGILIAERVLYLPACSVCLLAAALFDRLFERKLPWRAIGLALFCMVLCAAAVRDNYRNGDWFDQIAYLRGLARALPDSPMAPNTLEELGARLSLKGEYDEAIRYMRRALELRPDSVNAAYNTGILLGRVNRQDEAISFLERAARLAPKDIEIRNYYASALFRRNELDRARVEFESIIAFKPDAAEAHNSLGILYLRQQLLEKARAQFETALRIKPDYSDAAKNLQQLK